MALCRHGHRSPLRSSATSRLRHTIYPSRRCLPCCRRTSRGSAEFSAPINFDDAAFHARTAPRSQALEAVRRERESLTRAEGTLSAVVGCVSLLAWLRTLHRPVSLQVSTADSIRTMSSATGEPRTARRWSRQTLPKHGNLVARVYALPGTMCVLGTLSPRCP